jgi:hypothetical protein
VKIALCSSHAPWDPHRSGYHIDHALQEYDYSSSILSDLMPDLKSAGYDVERIDVSDKFWCTQPCPTSRTRKNHDCSSYRSGLLDQVKASALSDCALSFHIDYSAKHSARGGPLCLVNSDVAFLWASCFLDALERFTGFRRRGCAPVGGRKRDGVFDLRDKEIRGLFGEKVFLSRGAVDAVIAEVGVITSERDAAWMLTRQSVIDIVAAASEATKEVFHGARESN